jgi:TRAP-type mannitol/chloroaromatic compound transport system permease small subunit
MAFAVDRLNRAVGKTTGWLIVALTLVTSYDIVARKFFVAPLRWSYDVSYILYGTLFMLAGAYTLSRNAHVRGDMFYSRFTPRRQALLDLVLYVAFFYPGILALIVSGYDYAVRSASMWERSAVMANGIYIWPFKFVIPMAAVLMMVQGVVETVRCVQCLKTGKWPARLSDVEETETRLARESQL